MSQIGLRKEYKCSEEKNLFVWSDMTMTLYLETSFKVITPFDQMHYVGEVLARLDQGERIYDLDKDFKDNSAMTLSLDLETLFKATAHLLLKGTLWVKYVPDWATGREDIRHTIGHINY